ncbi:hypothetical protein BN2497_12153 [Janthinobacterium sp. CG23_2]|nr:hypothetical protein BN2497_12153 [Janthinobacterium sp. CG23_2]CUU32474.1 hypothetical protein BN3177_12153 [Janthinobacterium sp. CG23_2]
MAQGVTLAVNAHQAERAAAQLFEFQAQFEDPDADIAARIGLALGLEEFGQFTEGNHPARAAEKQVDQHEFGAAQAHRAALVGHRQRCRMQRQRRPVRECRARHGFVWRALGRPLQALQQQGCAAQQVGRADWREHPVGGQHAGIGGAGRALVGVDRQDQGRGPEAPVGHAARHALGWSEGVEQTVFAAVDQDDVRQAGIAQEVGAAAVQIERRDVQPAEGEQLVARGGRTKLTNVRHAVFIQKFSANMNMYTHTLSL